LVEKIMSTRCLFGGVLLGVLAVLSAAAAPANAQGHATTADLSGVVSDRSKALVPGATVTARNLATGVTRVVVSGPDGRYVVPALTPGTYSVTATLAGFEPQVYDYVTLALGQAAELDIMVRVARTKEEVTVVAEPELTSAGQTAVATIVTARQIDALPTNGRNFISFSVITPAVNTDRTPQQGASATSGLTFAGQRARSNNIMVDGLDNNDIASGAVRATFSQDAVQEFQVLANSFSAEFGKASGGIVNIVTKSGANTFSGDLFGYFRNEALNAKEHFEKFDPAGNRIDQPKAPYSQYQFGGTLGGPIRRNRSFFFLSAESQRIRANNFVNIDDTQPVTVAGQNYGTVVEALRRAGFPIELGNVPYRVAADQALAKVDATLPDNHHLTLRFNWADLLDENAEPWGGLVARSRGAYLDSRDLVGAAMLRSIVSPRTVNETRFQLANRDQKVISLDSTKCNGVCDRDNEGGPALDIGTIKVGRQPMTPQPRDARLYEVVNTLRHVEGRHDLDAGIDFSHVVFRALALPMYFGGRYIFQELGSLTPEQALVLGRPYAYVQGYGNPSAAGSVSDISLFAEDDWRVQDCVTLNLGVRYQNQFFPGLTDRVYGLTYDWPADNNNLAPRLAVSWNPFGGQEYLHPRGLRGLL
jgi:hypothetical protein